MGQLRPDTQAARTAAIRPLPCLPARTVYGRCWPILVIRARSNLAPSLIPPPPPPLPRRYRVSSNHVCGVPPKRPLFIHRRRRNLAVSYKYNSAKYKSSHRPYLCGKFCSKTERGQAHSQSKAPALIRLPIRPRQYKLVETHGRGFDLWPVCEPITPPPSDSC